MAVSANVPSSDAENVTVKLQFPPGATADLQLLPMLTRSLSSPIPDSTILVTLSGAVPGLETVTVIPCTDPRFTVQKLMLPGKKLINGWVTSNVTCLPADV
jgi:hypothetical protein